MVFFFFLTFRGLTRKNPPPLGARAGDGGIAEQRLGVAIRGFLTS